MQYATTLVQNRTNNPSILNNDGSLQPSIRALKPKSPLEVAARSQIMNIKRPEAADSGEFTANAKFLFASDTILPEKKDETFTQSSIKGSIHRNNGFVGRNQARRQNHNTSKTDNAKHEIVKT